MIDLTARQKFILNTIIGKGPLDVKDLSQEIDVSNRTISREVSAINNYLSDKNASIREINSILNIEGIKDNIIDIQQSLGAIPFQWLLSQEQRMILITAQLLMASVPYKSAYFSYQFNVVEGTISLYMDKIEQCLNIHNLVLNRKKVYGSIVNGSEWNKRNLFIELLYEYKTIDELIAFVYGSKDDPTINAFFKTTFDDETITVSRELLKFINNEMFNMDDLTYFSSFIHILLSIKKTKAEFPIKLPSNFVKGILSSSEFSYINKIQEYLSSFNIYLSDDELAYIAIQLLGNKYVYKSSNKSEELGVSLEDICNELVYEVSKKLNIKVKCDDQLILGLAQHINPAMYKINMGIQVKNLLLDQIREYYGNLFKVVNYACKIVFSKYNITMPQDEIGYITMHIGASIERNSIKNMKLSAIVICPNGIGTARILSSKIKSAIPSIKLVDISSFKDWMENSKKYDIILSTVNIEHRQKGKFKNLIMVSPFLQNSDIDKINDFIKKNLSGNSRIKNIIGLSNTEKSGNVEKDKYDIINDILKNLQLKVFDTNSVSKIISLITDNLLSEDLITDKEKVRNLIISREEMGNVVIPNSHVALLHTRSNAVTNPFIGVYRLKRPIKLKSVGFADENVDTFIVMLARKNEQNYILEQIGRVSIALIENKKFTEVLRLGDIKDLRSSLINILNTEEV